MGWSLRPTYAVIPLRWFAAAPIWAMLLLWSLAGAVAAQERAVPVTGGTASINTHLGILEDPSRALTIEEVSAPPLETAFSPPASDWPYMGFSDSAWWGRFSLVNPTDAPVEQIVEFGHPIIDRLEFYRPVEDGTGYRRQVTGDSVIGRDMDIRGRTNLYRVTVPPGEERRYYVRVSGDSSLAMDVTLHAARGFGFAGGLHDELRPLFFGILFAAIAYSLAIFLVLRDRLYLLFATFVFAVGGYHAETRGYLAAYVWPETTWLSNLTTIVMACLLILVIARFTCEFLDLQRNAPRADKILRVVQTTSVAAFFLFFVDYHVSAYLLIGSLIAGVAVAATVSAWLWRSGLDYARLYTICWLLFGAYALAASLEKLGLVGEIERLDLVFELLFSSISLFFAVVFTDRFRMITRSNERQLQVARDEAIAASKAKSKFLATMSHELRTPLNAVIGFSDILASQSLGPLGNTKYAEYAKDIKDSGLHLLYVINDLLEISRIEAEQVELDEQPINVPELLRRCVRIVEARAGQDGLVLQWRCKGDLPSLLGDETRVQQVLINLLYNAVKFTPRGGTVTIEADVEPGGDYRFAVTDTGIGIAEEDQQRILDPFVQVAPHLTRKHGGVGLGLSIAKSIVDLHGGRIAIDSELGRGTTFAVYFPAARVLRES